MKTRIAAILSFLLLIGFGCSKDDLPSVEQNKQTLVDLASVVDADLSEITESEGMKAINSLMDIFELDDPLGGIFKSDAVNRMEFKDWIRTGFSSGKAALDGGSDFDELTGTYTWEASVGRWSVQAGDPPDKIIINFPSEGSTSNNAVLTISDYEEEMFLDDWESWVDTIYQPTKIMADLVVDGTKYIDLSFSATWADYEMPSSITASLMIKPLSSNITFSDNGSLKLIAASLSINESVVVSVDLQAPYTKEMTEWGEEEVLTSLSGFIHYGTIKLAGEINIQALEDSDSEPTVEEINQYIKLALYNYGDGSKIADIKVVEGMEEIEIHLVFTDGSTEPAEKYLQPVLDKIEEQLGDLMEELELDI